jgi:hypothetical protein
MTRLCRFLFWREREYANVGSVNAELFATAYRRSNACSPAPLIASRGQRSRHSQNEIPLALDGIEQVRVGEHTKLVVSGSEQLIYLLIQGNLALVLLIRIEIGGREWLCAHFAIF